MTAVSDLALPSSRVEDTEAIERVAGQVWFGFN